MKVEQHTQNRGKEDERNVGIKPRENGNENMEAKRVANREEDCDGDAEEGEAENRTRGK